MSVLVDRTGQVFGKLRVIRRVSDDSTHEATWLCKCRCGKMSKVRGSNLRSGNTNSCGCGRRKRPFQWLYTRLKRGARKRKIACGLTYNQFLRFTSSDVCYYCGAYIKWEPFPVRSLPYSQAYNIDRTDNSRGYSVSNCVVCCGRCNTIKNTFSSDQFIQHCRKITEWQSQ